MLLLAIYYVELYCAVNDNWVVLYKSVRSPKALRDPRAPVLSKVILGFFEIFGLAVYLVRSLALGPKRLNRQGSIHNTTPMPENIVQAQPYPSRAKIWLVNKGKQPHKPFCTRFCAEIAVLACLL